MANKGRNLEAMHKIAGKRKEAFIYLNRFQQSKREQEKKGVDNSQLLFLHFENITRLLICSHSTLRRQFHIMDTFTKCLSGASGVGWFNTKVNLRLTWKLCMHSALGFTLREPTLFVSKSINARAM